MAFKRCTRIVYSTSAEDFDNLDRMLFDYEPMDFFIVWRRFTNYKTDYEKMELTANTLGLNIKEKKLRTTSPLSAKLF